MVRRCADERQAERDVDAVFESQRLCRDQRLVVIHADAPRRSRRAPWRGTWCRPGSGPLASMPSARSCAIAGAMISMSSRPMAPPSPACGLSPATASRGFAMPKRGVRSVRRHARGIDDERASRAPAAPPPARCGSSPARCEAASLAIIITGSTLVAGLSRAPVRPGIPCGPDGKIRRHRALPSRSGRLRTHSPVPAKTASTPARIASITSGASAAWACPARRHGCRKPDHRQAVCEGPGIARSRRR